MDIDCEGVVRSIARKTDVLCVENCRVYYLILRNKRVVVVLRTGFILHKQ